jgi:hypothetical protein
MTRAISRQARRMAAGAVAVAAAAMMLATALGSSCASASAVPDTGSEPAPAHWLMLVGTKNMDPAAEAAFNHWYDDIDIPDVLKVPGYRRARRGIRRSAESEDGQYVALYDIETTNMDRTIIDMLMAAKKMDMTGRSIDALKVTERVYFRQRAAVEMTGARTADKNTAAGKNTYLYLERVACCRDEASAAALNDWYDSTHLPDVTRAGVEGLVRLTRFEVHRVVMVEPRQVPRFLTVYEFTAGSADQVVAAMRSLNERLTKADRMSDLFVESGSAVFQQIRDERR